MRRALMGVAAGQSGYFTAAQAGEIGYTYASQKFHADHGNWVRVDRGIYRLPEWPAGENDSLIRWSLWARGRAVVSHDTAMSVHGLGDCTTAVVHLTVPPNFRSRAPGVRIHRGEVDSGDVESHGGFRVTTPLRTICDTAASGAGVEDLATAMRDALDAGLFTRSMLLARIDEFGPAAALGVERALHLVEARP